MFQINYIRNLHNCGYLSNKIQKTNACPKTIHKHLIQDNLSLKPPDSLYTPLKIISNTMYIVEVFKQHIFSCCISFH